MSVINTNVSATLTQNAITKNERAMSTAMEQLATGKRINRPVMMQQGWLSPRV